MILAVSLNLAVDVTFHVERIEHDAITRVPAVDRRAGGQGVNVARILQALGREVMVCGFSGGHTGAAAEAELRRSGIPFVPVPIDGESRMSTMVVEADGRATGFSEVGPQITGEDWRALTGRLPELVAQAEAMVLSGSVPRGVPEDCYGQLIQIARRARVPALLDTSGPPLLRGVEARPELVRITRGELQGAIPEPTGVRAGARALMELGAGAVVVSEGAQGMTCLCSEGILHAAPPQALRGNPTGAGDAAAAALVAGLVDGTPWSERLADAAALSAAAVCAPHAGDFDAGVYARLRRETKVRADA